MGTWLGTQNFSLYRNEPLKYYYYKTDNGQWLKLIPYHEIFPIILFFANKWAVYAWNFMDVFIATLCRAIYFKFETLHSKADMELGLSHMKFQGNFFHCSFCVAVKASVSNVLQIMSNGVTLLRTFILYAKRSKKWMNSYLRLSSPRMLQMCISFVLRLAVRFFTSMHNLRNQICF